MKIKRVIGTNAHPWYSDSALVENLEHTKKTAADIEMKVTEAKKTSFEIDKARELYRPAAARASVLYFILNDLYKINPIYQFSLKAFSVVFHVAIERAEPAEDVNARYLPPISPDFDQQSINLSLLLAMFELI